MRLLQAARVDGHTGLELEANPLAAAIDQKIRSAFWHCHASLNRHL
jgi:hypothetical protein